MLCVCGKLKLHSLMYCVAFLLNGEFLVATATQQDKAIVVRVGGIYSGAPRAQSTIVKKIWFTVRP